MYEDDKGALAFGALILGFLLCIGVLALLNKLIAG